MKRPREYVRSTEPRLGLVRPRRLSFLFVYFLSARSAVSVRTGRACAHLRTWLRENRNKDRSFENNTDLHLGEDSGLLDLRRQGREKLGQKIEPCHLTMECMLFN